MTAHEDTTMTTDNWTPPKRKHQPPRKPFKAREVPKWQRMVRHAGRKQQTVSLPKSKERDK
jgi:hypothetical protein